MVGEPVPAVIVNEPAESVEPVVTAAVGEPVPQLVGVPTVGAVVWVDWKWALVMTRLAKVLEVPATVIKLLVVSASNSVVVPAAFWIWKPIVESLEFWNKEAPLLSIYKEGECVPSVRLKPPVLSKVRPEPPSITSAYNRGWCTAPVVVSTQKSALPDASWI